MNITQLQQSVRDGRSLRDLARELDVSPRTLYRRLQDAGTPVNSLRPTQRAREYRPIPEHPGYRIGSNGVVQSCWSPRSGEQTEHWRDLSLRWQSRHQSLFVQLGASDGHRQRISLRKLLHSAWGEQRGEQIYQQTVRRLSE